MPRILKRLTLVFAVLALGLLLAGFLALLWLAHSVRTDQTEPVRKQLVADWEKNADALEQHLLAAAPWSTTTAPTPPELGCQLRWTGESVPVARHLARCQDVSPPLDFALLATLEQPGAQLLVKADTLPVVERDLSWMARLRGHDDWSAAEGTPFEFFDVNGTFMEAPALSMRHVRALAMLRLLEGQRTGALDAAVEDVVALARALLGRPFVLDQLIGVAVLDAARAALDAAGHPDLGPKRPELQALRAARLASAFLWHPWVPKAQRERFLPKLAPASRCAAASETLLLLEVGAPLQENYPQFVADLAAWTQTKPCQSELVQQAVAARAALPEGSWQHLLGSAGFAAKDEASSRLLVQLIEGTSLGRATVTELIFSVMVARPFAPPAEPKP